MDPTDPNLLQITKDRYLALVNECGCTKQYEDFMQQHKKGTHCDKMIEKISDCIKRDLVAKRKTAEQKLMHEQELMIQEKFKITQQ